ncbi:MAG: hypothetical protein K6V97_06050 [Actinomycetia bacterium]|nr:hypothetical protein [Actinomycetes bacterium]
MAIGAHTAVPLTPAGRPIPTHARQFGTTRTDSVDVALDQASRTERKEALHALAECTDRFRFDHAVRALEAALAQAWLAYGNILVLATQMALGPQPPAAGPDLTVYDQLLPQRGTLQ